MGDALATRHPAFAPFGLAAAPAVAAGHDALSLYATVLGASSLASAAQALAAALAAQEQLDRVSIGLHDADRTRLVASLDLDLGDPQAELHQRLLGAIDEAVEQKAAVQWPDAPLSGDAARAITLEHRALQALTGGSVATLPFGQDGRVYAAVCLERHGDGVITAADLDRIERRLALAVPALRWMHEAKRSAWQRARGDLADALAKLRRPEHAGARRLLGAVALGLAVLGAAPLEHAVSGRARVQGAEQRILPAPTDGFLGAAHVRPGDRVRAGQVLVDLVEGDLRLERQRWASQLAQHENAYAAAMGKSDRVAASTSAARISEAEAQLALVDQQLTRARITAPFDALVVQGDLTQSIGAPVRQGDPLLTLATTADYRVVVEIDETDIGRVRKGQRGRLALSSLPWEGLDVQVERIAPLAKAVDGRNVFEVEAHLAAPATELRPGLLGRADLVVGRMPPLWAWCRHAVERIRLAYWAWLG